MSQTTNGNSHSGVNSFPVTDHDSDFVPHREDFKEALDEDQLKDKGSKLLGLFLHTRVMRAWARFTEANGRLLAAGISFMALFSLTAAITLAGMLFSTILKKREGFSDTLAEAINAWLPGLVKSSTTPEGLVSLDALGASPGTGAASIILAGVLIYSASYVVASLSMSIRAMFGLSTVKEPYLIALGQRLLGLVFIVLGLGSTAGFLVLDTYIRSAGHRIATPAHHSWVNLFSQTLSAVTSLAINMGIMVAFVWWVAGVHPPRRDLLSGSFLAAAGTTGLRLVGTSVVTNVTGPILTAATGLITLVVWINLQALVLLFASAWMANPPRLRTRAKVAFRRGMKGPNYETLSDPTSLTSVSGDHPSAASGGDAEDSDPTTGDSER